MVEPVLEKLKESPTSVVVKAAYRAIFKLDEASARDAWVSDRQGIHVGFELYQPDPIADATAAQVLQTIERQEGEPVQSIPGERRRMYIATLATYAAERAKADSKVAPAEAEAILIGMRDKYST